MKFNFIHSEFSFDHQMAGYRAIIEICAFQLANNGLAIKMSPFLRLIHVLGLLALKRQLFSSSPKKRANFYS